MIARAIWHSGPVPIAGWHSGPPPSVGWWPASISQQDGNYRWWNGRWWSLAARANTPLEDVALIANMAAHTAAIQWQHRPAAWPDRSFT